MLVDECYVLTTRLFGLGGIIVLDCSTEPPMLKPLAMACVVALCMTGEAHTHCYYFS